ncbi:MAG: 50S ribosomal protein L24 [Fimbriimonadaceae bacterium]|nr:50S ribosomal protein L24 [Fimbriimonadaceae bacterium]
MQRKRPDTRSQPRPRIGLLVGDTVEVISGKDLKQRGQVSEVLPREQMVRVAGVALVTKHQKATGRSRTMQRQAGRIQMPGKIHISNVQLVCPTCGQRTRPKMELSEGLKTRVCRQCGADIPRAAVEE